VPTLHRTIQAQQAEEAVTEPPAPVKEASFEQDLNTEPAAPFPPWEDMVSAERVVYCILLYVICLFGPVWSLFDLTNDWRSATYFLVAVVAVGAAWYQNQRLRIVVTGPYETRDADTPESSLDRPRVHSGAHR